MPKDKQTIILETSASFRNGVPMLAVAEKIIDNYIKETFSGLTDQEILEKIKTML
jgi:hypothetical protein